MYRWERFHKELCMLMALLVAVVVVCDGIDLSLCLGLCATGTCCS